jgi:vanillate O-demethylase monooxygenase subunit
LSTLNLLTKTPPRDGIVKNAWYLAAWSDELANGQMLARRIAGEPMVLGRDNDGAAFALVDRCPHRRYPLTEGRFDGETITCGYHGFRFGLDGTCIGVPAQTNVPASANVRPFPLTEEYGGLWVFPGDPALAAMTVRPVHPWITEWPSATGYAPLKARASLLIDNLLDLSHETYIHASGIGTPEVAETPVDTERVGNALWVRRKMYGVECPPNYARSTGLSSPIDRFQEIEYTPPCLYVLHSRVAAAGDRGRGFNSKVIYCITPETERTMHNFFAICREPQTADDRQRPLTNQRNTVVEDTLALELLERTLSEDEAEGQAVPEVSIGIDRGGLIGRRMIADLLRLEMNEA